MRLRLTRRLVTFLWDGHETLELLEPVFDEDDLRVGIPYPLDHHEPLAVRVYVVVEKRATEAVRRLDQHIRVHPP